MAVAPTTEPRTTGWAPVLAAMTATSEAYEPRGRVVLGPAPCTTCGAWIEWLGVGAWVALGSDEPHECEPYLRAGADALAIALSEPPLVSPEPAWLTGRLLVGLGLVAVFFALVLARWQAGLL